MSYEDIIYFAETGTTDDEDTINSPVDEPDSNYAFEKAKKILYFTSYFHMKDWNFGVGHKPFVDHKCPVTNCYITNKRSDLRKHTVAY